MSSDDHSSRSRQEHEGNNVSKATTAPQTTALRIASALPPALEALVRQTIGACLAVHRKLGLGLGERAYARACCVELEFRRMSFEVEKSVPLTYRGRLLCQHRIDLFVERQVVVEIKSVDQIHPVHVAQVVSYLRLTGARVGLVVNFNVPVLKQGIRRVVLCCENELRVFVMNGCAIRSLWRRVTAS
jgi:GxxExxY protein